LIDAVQTLGQDVGVRQACQALGVPRGSFYRHRSGPNNENRPARTPSPRALSGQERQRVKDLLYSERFADQAPRQVFAILIDEGKYHCSVRTMYRLLNEDQTNRERRNQLRHPNYQKPELLATAPNQVWSWDITKLLGPEKWTYYYLYVILDIFSRYVVGWMLARGESADLASRLIRETLTKQNVGAAQLIIHSDRGPSMTSHSVAQLLATLGVTKSHSRPHVSNDNPFSESQFKTLKYCPSFPSRFDGYEHALGFCRTFMPWYNDEHYHSGIGLVTPAMLHYGQAPEVLAARQRVLETAYRANPERFVRGLPRIAKLPTTVWINPPKIEPLGEDEKERIPEPNCPWKPAVSLTHPRPGYPSPSCVPAELDSVSPGIQKNNPPPTYQQPLNTRAMSSKIPGVRGQAPDEDNLARSEIFIH